MIIKRGTVTLQGTCKVPPEILCALLITVPLKNILALERVQYHGGPLAIAVNI